MSHHRRRVLCAEPHEDTCFLITTMLGAQGHEVVSAGTVHDCLELARRERFDLYMLDDDYVDGTSIELCRELRALTPETPILFFSSLAFPRDRERALEAGCDEHWTKPITDLMAFKDMVTRVIAEGRRGRG